MKKGSMKLRIWDTERFSIGYTRLFILNHVFEEMVGTKIFYRDPKKCFSPSKISSYDKRKIKIIRTKIGGTRKKTY